MIGIRLHGRGGQGIKTASQVLGSALFRAGFEVQDAPRYGAERRGAPIFAYVRATHGTIHARGVIAQPDLVVVADASLVPVATAGVLQGVGADTVFLIADDAPAEQWRERLRLAGPVLAVRPAADPALTGIACTGAAARLLGVIGRDTLAAAIDEELARYGEPAIARSRELALAAFDAMAAHAGCVRERALDDAVGLPAPDWIELPQDGADLASPDIHAGATSELAATGVWRTMRPVIDLARCNRCAWVCSTLCPDSAIDVSTDRTPAIDYAHCKGCMICVAVCPPHAIHAIAEKEARA
jgi:pyruvate ferredoxin oxidoreductase gamma subunit